MWYNSDDWILEVLPLIRYQDEKFIECFRSHAIIVKTRHVTEYDPAKIEE